MMLKWCVFLVLGAVCVHASGPLVKYDDKLGEALAVIVPVLTPFVNNLVHRIHGAFKAYDVYSIDDFHQTIFTPLEFFLGRMVINGVPKSVSINIKDLSFHKQKGFNYDLTVSFGDISAKIGQIDLKGILLQHYGVRGGSASATLGRSSATFIGNMNPFNTKCLFTVKKIAIDNLVAPKVTLNQAACGSECQQVVQTSNTLAAKIVILAKKLINSTAHAYVALLNKYYPFLACQG